MQNILVRHLKPLSCRISTRFSRYLCDFGFKHTFTNDQVTKILQIINSSTAEELSRYSIAKFRLQKITIFRQQCGKFNSLDELLELDEFGVKVLEKFCHSIVEMSEKGSTPHLEKKSPQILTPKLTEKQRSRIKSCCAVQIGTDSVTWCCLEVQSRETTPTAAAAVATHWQYSAVNAKKSHLAELTQRILQISEMIPVCDVYVLETPIARQSSPSANAIQISVNIQHSQLIAMISVILAQRRQQNDEPSVFFIRKYLDARLFGTLVGQERISSVDVVGRILSQESTDQKTAPTAQIQASPDILTRYSDSDGVEKEYMGRSLMLAVSFLRLCILKCPESLAALSRKSK